MSKRLHVLKNKLNKKNYITFSYDALIKTIFKSTQLICSELQNRIFLIQIFGEVNGEITHSLLDVCDFLLNVTWEM